MGNNTSELYIPSYLNMAFNKNHRDNQRARRARKAYIEARKARKAYIEACTAAEKREIPRCVYACGRRLEFSDRIEDGACPVCECECFTTCPHCYNCSIGYVRSFGLVVERDYYDGEGMFTDTCYTCPLCRENIHGDDLESLENGTYLQ